MEEKEVLAAVNLELNRVFKVNYKLPNNPQNYSRRCIECKKPLFYNPNLNSLFWVPLSFGHTFPPLTNAINKVVNISQIFKFKFTNI